LVCSGLVNRVLDGVLVLTLQGLLTPVSTHVFFGKELASLALPTVLTRALYGPLGIAYLTPDVSI
jgi:hypothetical protein